MSSINEINQSSSTRSTSIIDAVVSQDPHSKVVLCPNCHTPMKRRSVEKWEGAFYSCSPCDSVRRSLPDEEDEEVDVAITARERHFLERLHLARAFI